MLSGVGVWRALNSGTDGGLDFLHVDRTGVYGRNELHVQAEAGREETILTVLRLQVLVVPKAFLTLPGFDF